MNKLNKQVKIAFIVVIVFFSFQTLKAQPFVVQTGVISQPNIQYFKWGDYDNDGDGDYLVYHWSELYDDGWAKWIIKIFNNNGNNVFAEKATILSTLSQITPSWADIDNDGDLDILLSGGYMNSYAEIYKNNGNSNFSKLPGITMPGLSWGASAWADFDKDGYLDVIITGHTETGVTKLYRNNGNYTFTEQAGGLFAGVCFRSAVDWGDYDNDGNLDILLSGNTGYSDNDSAVTRIYRNNGSGSFTGQTNISLLGVGSGISSFGDYNNDGFLDILLAGKGYCKIYKNNGVGGFTEQNDIVLTGIYNGSASWGDYDMDGYLDILLTGDASNGLERIPVTKIYRNNGNGNFSEQTNIQLFIIMNNSNWVDYDSDGDLDILIYGNYSSGGKLRDTTLLYRNDLVQTSILTNPVSDPQLIKIYPNPANDRLFLKNIKSSYATIAIFDLQGNPIGNNKIVSNFVDISDISKGIYLVKIVDSGNIVINKLIKE